MAPPRRELTDEQRERVRAGRTARPPVHFKVLAADIGCSVFRIVCEWRAIQGQPLVRRRAPRSDVPVRLQRRVCLMCRERAVWGWSYCRSCRKRRALDCPADE